MTEKEIYRQIPRYINGELNEEQEDQLWVEFLKEPKYFKRFELELNLYDLCINKNFRPGSGSSESPRAEEERVPYRGILFAAAAAILLIAGLSFFFMQDRGVSSLALSEIEATEVLGSESFRGERLTPTQIDTEINRSLALALDGEMGESYLVLRELSSQQLTEHQEVRITYNKGVVTYNTGNFSASAEYFDEVIRMETVPDYLQENSLWYKSNAFLKLNDTERAEAGLTRVVEKGGVHSEKAEQALRRLGEFR